LSTTLRFFRVFGVIGVSRNVGRPRPAEERGNDWSSVAAGGDSKRGRPRFGGSGLAREEDVVAGFFGVSGTVFPPREARFFSLLDVNQINAIIGHYSLPKCEI